MRFRSLLYFLCCLSFCVVLSAQKYIPKKFTFSGFADANQTELLAASGLKEGSAVGQEECARFIAERQIPLARLLTHRFALDQAAEAYRLFDTQTTGKGVFVF